MAFPRVFVTYHFVDVTHRDYQFAIGLINDLRTAGVDVMAEGTAMQHGNFVQYLNEVLPTCQWLILVQTPDALRSPQVQMAVNTALTLVVQQRMRGVLPVIAVACEPQEVPVTWATLKTYDATLDYQRTLARVLLTLGLDPVPSTKQAAVAPPPSHIITSSSTIDKPVGHPSKPGLPGTRDFSSTADRPEKLTPVFTIFERVNAIPESHPKWENHLDTPILLALSTRQHRKRWLTALSVALALVLLITSVVLATRSFSKNSPHPTAPITSAAIAKLNATATANANTTATVDANLTATGREVNSTTTARASATEHANADATAIAQATASAIANENTTATATSVALAQPGTKWTTQQSGTSKYIQTIIWSGSQYVAVGEAGTILTSDNGVTWISHSLNTSKTFASIAWSGTQYVVAGQHGTILTSNDGITWMSRLSGTLNDLQDIIWSKIQSQYVAVGQAGTILTSSDGVAWMPHYLDASNYFWHIAWSGTQYVLVGDGGAIFTSGDGISWIPQNSNTSNNLIGITASTSQYVAVGGAGTILTSGDGITWLSQASNISSNLWSITETASQYIVVGDTGTILTSSNGIIWVSQTSNTLKYLLGITWSGSKFIAVGRAGAILSSP